jgi:hypothetical protein
MRYGLLFNFNNITCRHWTTRLVAYILWSSSAYVVFLNFSGWQFNLCGVNCGIDFLSWEKWDCLFNHYHHTWPYYGLKIALSKGLASHILVSLCLLGCNLCVCTKPEKRTPSQGNSWRSYPSPERLILIDYFQKIKEPPYNSRCQKSDTKQDPYWEPTNIRDHNTKLSHLDSWTQLTCAPLVMWSKSVMVAVSSIVCIGYYGMWYRQ